MRLLGELNEQGITVVLVTHEPDIAAWAKRRITFRDGHVLEDHRQQPVRRMATDAEAGSGAGDASMNVLAALRSACAR